MSLKAPLYKIVLERSASFQHYYLMQVYPPVPLTVTIVRYNWPYFVVAIEKPRSVRVNGTGLCLCAALGIPNFYINRESKVDAEP